MDTLANAVDALINRIALLDVAHGTRNLRRGVVKYTARLGNGRAAEIITAGADPADHRQL